MKIRIKRILRIMIISLIALSLYGCSNKVNVIETTPKTDLGEYIPNELVATCNSIDEAKAIAELYGIELIDYSDGVAVFFTEEDLDDVIQKGINNKYPELSKNYIYSLIE